MTEPLNILWVNGKNENIPEKIAELRKKLSPQGDIVSPRGRQRSKRSAKRSRLKKSLNESAPISPPKESKRFSTITAGSTVPISLAKRSAFPGKRSKRLIATPIPTIWLLFAAFVKTSLNSRNRFCTKTSGFSAPEAGWPSDTFRSTESGFVFPAVLPHILPRSS